MKMLLLKNMMVSFFINVHVHVFSDKPNHCIHLFFLIVEGELSSEGSSSDGEETEEVKKQPVEIRPTRESSRKLTIQQAVAVLSEESWETDLEERFEKGKYILK